MWIAFAYIKGAPKVKMSDKTRSRTLLKLSAQRFLQLVGFEYVAVGMVGLGALFLPSGSLLIIGGLSSMYLLVSPRALTLEYGIQAYCFEHPREAWGCNLDSDVIEHARFVVMVLCIMSVLGGLAGVWAASTKDKQAGRAVWLLLIVVSVGVLLWNLMGSLNPFANPVPMLFTAGWVAAYTMAYFRWLRNDARFGQPNSVSKVSTPEGAPNENN
jgi:uncharacterized protein (DUF697 family)